MPCSLYSYSHIHITCEIHYNHGIIENCNVCLGDFIMKEKPQSSELSKNSFTSFFHLCCKSWGKIYQSFSCMYVWISTIGQSYQKCWKRSGRIWKICDNATCRLRLRRMTKHYMNVRKFHIWILPIVTAGHMSNYRRHYNSFNFK